MSKNLKKKALSFGSMLGLVVSGVVSMPATALEGEVELAPDTGTNWGVFLDDQFDIDVDIRNGNGLYEVDGDADLSPAVTLEVTNIAGKDFEGYVYISDSDEDALNRIVRSEQLLVPTYVDGAYTGLDYVGFIDDFVATAYNAKGEYIDDYVLFDSTDYEVDLDATDYVDIEGWYEFEESDFVLGGETIARVVVSGIPDFDRDLDYSLDQYENSFGDGDVSFNTRVWIENSGNSATVETAYASPVKTVTWYDPKSVIATPRIERFVSDDDGIFLNDEGGDYSNGDIGFSIQFSKPVNLDQIDLGDWYVDLLEDGSSVDDETLEGDDTYAVELYGNGEYDDENRLYVGWDDDDFSIDESDSFRVTVAYNLDETARTYTSTSFKVASTSVDEVSGLSWTSSDSANVLLQDDEYTYDAYVRSGTKSVTWTAQLMDDVDTALEQAGVPVLAVVWTDSEDSTLEDGKTITVSGNVLDNEYDAVVLAGNTNDDGQFSITVTHSSATEGEGYYVEFLYLGDNGDYYNDAAVEADADINVYYEDAYVDALEVDSEVVAAANVTLEYSVVDQFGEPMSKYDGDALSVELLSTNSDDVEQYKAVGSDGTATFTFKNYLVSPDTDVLTASVGVGLTASTFEGLDVSSAQTSLYAPINVSSIILDTTLSTYVAYDDFVTAKTGGPSDTSVELSGTVAGADNGGLPGAPVVIKGAGLQFYNGSSYTVGETTVIADVDGNFSVDVWTHTASAAGQSITVTAGSVTKTVKLTSFLPDDLDGDNLSFTWTLPAEVVKDTTYAVTLKLADKWGNPLNTSGSATKAVTVEAAGSLEVNGVDEVSKNFGSDGTTVVYIRSVKDIAGPGSLVATLDAAATYASVDGDGDSASFDLDDLGAITTDNDDTAWDETKWSSELEQTIQVLDAPAGKVNVGSFNGKLVVYASGLAGAKISWKVGGNWGSAVAASNFARFDRPTPRSGVDVTVDIYVNGVKKLTKVVRTR
jgi:hypothetical protein